MKIDLRGRLLALGLVLVSLSGCGGASDGAARDSSARHSADVDTRADGDRSTQGEPPVLFRVEGEQGPSYLLGTIHMLVSLEEALPSPELRAALERARVVVTEADPRQIGSAPELIQRYAIAPSSSSVQAQLTADQWAQLTAELGPIGLPPEAIDRLRPWFVTTTLTAARAGAIGEGRAPQMMDLQVLEEADGRQQPLRFLESMEAQLALLAGIDEAAMLGWLTEMLDEPEDAKEELMKLVEAYREGDLETLVDLTLESEDAEKHPAYIEAFFHKRNRAWMPLLTEELGRGGAFVAVGAGHLVGPRGLVALLREAGLEVERVGRD